MPTEVERSVQFEVTVPPAESVILAGHDNVRPVAGEIDTARSIVPAKPLALAGRLTKLTVEDPETPASRVNVAGFAEILKSTTFTVRMA